MECAKPVSTRGPPDQTVRVEPVSQKVVDWFSKRCIIPRVEGGANAQTSASRKTSHPIQVDSARQCQLGRRSRPPQSLPPSWHSHLWATEFSDSVYCRRKRRTVFTGPTRPAPTKNLLRGLRRQLPAARLASTILDHALRLGRQLSPSEHPLVELSKRLRK